MSASPHSRVTFAAEPFAPELSVVLPARNEAEIIASTVRTVAAFLAEVEPSYEIIVGDSASSDGTADRVRALGLDRVRVVREERPGKGRVLTAAFRSARGRIVGFLDADLEIPVQTLVPLLDGLRQGPHAAIAVKDPGAARPLGRRLLTGGYNALVALLLGSRLADHQAGCKLFDGPALRALLAEGPEPSPGWLWDTEILLRLQRRGAWIHSVPSVPEATRPSRFRISDIALAGRDLLRLWARLSTKRDVTPLVPSTPVDAPSLRV